MSKIAGKNNIKESLSLILAIMPATINKPSPKDEKNIKGLQKKPTSKPNPPKISKIPINFLNLEIPNLSNSLIIRSETRQ